MSHDRRTALVTGSTDGVGRYVASRLAESGAHVLVHGRDRARGEQVVEGIQRLGRGSAEFHQADLASLAQVRELARTIQLEHRRLDLLVNNAGIGRGPPGGVRETSADACELRFAVNYLAGFLLTRLLVPLLTATAPARIVNVASAGQRAIDFDDVMLTRNYTGMRAYMQSKLAQVLFTFDLARELEGTGVTVNALHPATYMPTTMLRETGMTPASTIEEGGDAILRLATSPEVEGTTGQYFIGTKASHADAQAYDPAARTRLRTLSFELTGLAPRSVAGVP